MPLPPARKSRPRIAIVGASFAGLAAAKKFGRDYAVTVIDRSPTFEWLPNLHELLSGVKRPADLRLSRPRLVARYGHRFIRASVAAVDAEAGRLVTADKRQFEFDLCIVAVGGVNDTFGVVGADRFALPFKGVQDCDIIGRKLATLARRPGKHSVVIVGGGLEGIEALGEILRRYRHHPAMSVTVVEAGPHLLMGSPPTIDAAVRARAAAGNVRFLTNSPVTKVTPRQVRLRSGEILRSDLTIWTGGSVASPLLYASGLVEEPGQWAPVTRTLRSRRFNNVFVVGDAAALPHRLGKQAYYAMQMGECAAENAVRALHRRALRSFTPSAKPMLIAFGDLDTFLVSGRAVIASPALAAVKEAVFQLTMAQIDPPFNAPARRALATRLIGATGKLALPTLAADTRARLRRFAISDRRRKRRRPGHA